MNDTKETLEHQLAQALERARVAEKANRTKSEFLINLSYKLRTSLSTIMGMAQLLYMDCLLPKQQECVKTVINTSEYILSLLDDLLQSSQLETGVLKVVPEAFDFRMMMQEIISMLAFHAEVKNIQLVLNYPQNVTAQVIGAAHLIRRIVVSLSIYMVNRTNHGSVIIQVSDASVANAIELTIRFKGTGELSVHEMKQIQSFFRLEESDPMRYYAGVDLGLSIAVLYLKWIQGRLELNNQNGYTVIQCILPLTLPDTKPEFVINESVPAYQILKPLNILLIEDDHAIQKTHKLLLEKIGCRVDLTDNVNNAFDFYKTNAYDLILIDIGLPQNGSIEFTKTVRQLEGEESKRPIPMIAITAHGYACDHTLFLNSGIDAVLVKPVNLKRLYELLKNWTND
jgi:CheY-like chemotaxis protein